MKTRNCRSVRATAYAALIAAAMAGCSAQDAEGEPGVVAEALTSVPGDGETSFGERELVTTIELDTGGRLDFVELAPGAIAVLEQTPAGAPSIDRIDELSRDAALADVFHAWAAPGTPVPDKLLATGAASMLDRPQGWARAALAHSARITTGNCNNSTFGAWFADYSYNDRGTPDLRLDQQPETSAYFDPYDYVPGNGLSYDFWRYVVGGNIGSVWYDVDRYVSRVALCHMDVYAPETPQLVAHPSISYQGYVNTHMGPVVTFRYRTPGTNVWQTAASHDFSAGEVGGAVYWHFYSSVDWDWRTDIYWAGADDSFDIGHAVEDL